MGLPFDTKQSDGEVKFWFGGADEPTEVLKITAVQDGKIYGYFEGTEDRPQVFIVYTGESAGIIWTVR